MMKALTYLKPGLIRYQSVAKPKLLKSTDIIGKTLLTTVCGSDLHFWEGAIPETNELAEKNGSRGIVLGHEGIVRVEQVGSDVKKFKPGDVCIVSCITPCGTCWYCKNGCEAHCIGNDGTSGIILGHEIDGMHAEYVRVPFADNCMYKCPEGVPLDSLLMLSDIFPTSYELGVLDGRVKEGSSVAIIGMGPVGLAALLSAKVLKPDTIIAIDLDDTRLAVAKKLGATYTINPKNTDPVDFVMKLPTKDGRGPGVDTAIECAGSPVTFKMCQDMIATNGTIANVGIQTKPSRLDIERLWFMNVKITMGVVNASSTSQLLKQVVAGELDPSPLITHHFKLSEAEKAYELFRDSANSHAIKVVLTNE
ncbi:DEKNAAC104112 [Brettanomyces naardenensis]|uniref:DEKNAAC104112 n=1 Tax=Brettanomyces naardenensis TaxID=13370 RepID=A0A448YQ52_BRENA|nr:DEKNAAC104112 [Brettanomyces naardenensis]